MERESRDLVLIDQARNALDKARTVPELIDVRDTAGAIERYLSRRLGAERARRYALEIRLGAEKRIGHEFRKTIRHRGGRPVKNGEPSTLFLPAGVSKKQSQWWQWIASLDDETFEKAIAKADVSTKSLVRLAKEKNKLDEFGDIESPTCTVSDLDTLVQKNKTFGTIYADPPWKYGNQGTRAATDNHYGTIKWEEIAAYPIEKLAAESAHLHLWTTSSFLRQAFEIIDAWGFEYKSSFVWVKPEMGIGNYWRLSHEFMLLGVRGSCPFLDRSQESWLRQSRTTHSAKPDKVRQMVELVSPGPRLELFARTITDGWTAWGNEIERNLFTEAVEELD